MGAGPRKGSETLEAELKRGHVARHRKHGLMRVLYKAVLRGNLKYRCEVQGRCQGYVSADSKRGAAVSTAASDAAAGGVGEPRGVQRRGGGQLSGVERQRAAR